MAAAGAAGDEATTTMRQWLDEIQSGYGRFEDAFASVGVETVSNLRDVDPTTGNRIVDAAFLDDHLKKALYDAGARPFHFIKICGAILGSGHPFRKPKTVVVTAPAASPFAGAPAMAAPAAPPPSTSGASLPSAPPHALPRAIAFSPRAASLPSVGSHMPFDIASSLVCEESFLERLPPLPVLTAATNPDPTSRAALNLLHLRSTTVSIRDASGVGGGDSDTGGGGSGAGGSGSGSGATLSPLPMGEAPEVENTFDDALDDALLLYSTEQGGPDVL